MNLNSYEILISNLPVNLQSFVTKRLTWKKAEDEFSWLPALNNKIFENQKEINISRQDIFNTKYSIRELILKTIYWGYPGNMRGNNFVNILKNIPALESTLSDLKNTRNLTSIDFIDFTNIIKEIPGIHLSTYSKLLYFLKIEFDNNPCLILDQRLIDVFAKKIFNEFLYFEKINYDNAEKQYLKYIEITNKLALDLNTHGENIELFLFAFGNNLKS